MVDVVADAVHRLGREEWWSSVRDALEDLAPSEVDAYQMESRRLDAAAIDGLNEH